MNGKDQILQENQQKKKALNDMAAHQKAMFALQVDQELKKQEAAADHDMNKKNLVTYSFSESYKLFNGPNNRFRISF